jgi:hypothetical protein
MRTSTTLRVLTALVLGSGLAACGGDDDGGDGPDIDAPPANQMVTVSGIAQTVMGTSQVPLEGATIEAYRRGNATALATTTSGADGTYSVTIETGGVGVDGYLKGTSATRLDTYLYPPRPLTEDRMDATMLIVNQQTLGLLGTLGGADQDPAKGFIGLIVQDGNGTGIAGAVVTIDPLGDATIIYAVNGLPNANAEMTDASGTVFIANTNVGEIEVDATAGSMQFHEHSVEARAGVITTTLLDP